MKDKDDLDEFGLESSSPVDPDKHIAINLCQVGLDITFQIQNPTAATLTINGRAVL